MRTDLSRFKAFPAWAYSGDKARLFYSLKELASADGVWFDSPALEKAEEAKQGDEMEITAQDAVDALDDMSKADLLQIASDNSIEVNARASKAKIVEAIKQAMGQ